MRDVGSQVGLVFCACWDDHISFKLRGCGFMVLCISISLTLAVILPYFTMLASKMLPAFLPLISDAAGYPPSTGVFAVCLIIGSFFGFTAFPILYYHFKHRNVKNSKLVRIANKLGLLSILLSSLGLVITGAFPIGYTDIPNMFEWIMTVLWEHSVGATMILAGSVAFQFFSTAVLWLLPDTNRRSVYIRLPFLCAYILFFFLNVYPLPAYLLEQLGPNPFDFDRMKNTVFDLPRKYSVNYLICSLCEYGTCLLGAFYMGMFYKELQKVSFRVVLRHKSCVAEFEEPTPSIKLKNIS